MNLPTYRVSFTTYYPTIITQVWVIKSLRVKSEQVPRVILCLLVSRTRETRLDDCLDSRRTLQLKRKVRCWVEDQQETRNPWDTQYLYEHTLTPHHKTPSHPQNNYSFNYDTRQSPRMVDHSSDRPGTEMKVCRGLRPVLPQVRPPSNFRGLHRE